MLGGVVRQPLSPPPAGRSEMMPPSTYGEGPTKAAGSGRGHDHHREGREMIVPLIRRPAPLRLDVAPFLVAYLALAILDLHGRGGADEEPRSGRLDWTAILVDASYALLLLSQLALFFACQWDPLWRARVAYRRCRRAGERGEGMKAWTHALVVPPNPHHPTNDARKGIASSTGTPASRQTVVRPERPGVVPVTLETTSAKDGEATSFVAVIRFRGWTYRCCGDGDGDPMESVWEVGTNPNYIEEISDDDEDEGNGNDGSDNGSKDALLSSSSSSSSSSWEPHFRRLHFPVDLPLSFYTAWNGHVSPSSLASIRRIYGTNRTVIPLPPYLSLLSQQLVQPMFLFQLLCVLLWCMDEYWMYAVFTLCTLLMFEGVQALNRWKSVKRLREEVVGADAVGDEEGGDANGDSGGGGHGARREAVGCYRSGGWTKVPTNELVVGDVISLISRSVHNRQQGKKNNMNAAVRNVHDHEQGSTVPADLLLLAGRAVVNEAMLTGESVPQVKEAVEVGDGNERLDLGDGGAHKRSVLFGGTVLMDHHSSPEEGEDAKQTASLLTPNVPPPPNAGLVCFVLRTGFDTVQGQLLRTLAYHAESGGGGSGGGEGVNSAETFFFLLLLLLCALVSAGTVVQHAWGDVTRNRFKLALHVVIIVTSVIPPELPMELSLAVTTSLAELVKAYQVYCTEPFRIPLAGLVDTCCFDKTGTLTSDQLRLHGVRLPKNDVAGNVTSDDKGFSSANEDDKDLILFDEHLSKEEDEFTSVKSILPRDTLRIMVGCQSLAITHVLAPDKRTGRTMVKTDMCGDPLERAVVEACGYTVHPRTEVMVERGSLLGNPSEGGPAIRVLHRFAFSSKLRRMTVLAVDDESGAGDGKATLWALTKGAPEALGPMLDPASVPVDYERSYLRHMALGRRVLALAYRNLGTNNAPNLAEWKSSRDSVEQKLSFGGLLVMDSPLKADSARVVKELRQGSQNVVMVTGDAVLTAAEVARRVGIIDATKGVTYELCCIDDMKGTESSSNGGQGQSFAFRQLGRSMGTNPDGTIELTYTLSNVPKLKALAREGKASFCVTGDVLTKLAFHAVATASAGKDSVAVDEHTVLNHPAARSALSQLAPLISVFARHAPRHKEAVVDAFNSSGRHTLMCGDGTNDVGALKRAHVGVSIVSVPDLEAKQRDANDEINAVRAEEKKERKRNKAKKKESSKSKLGSSTRPKRSRAERVDRSLQALAEAEDELNYISLGNASVASPFTSRNTSVRCCKDIVRQGRCTLVTMIQIYKILGVHCLVNALVLTKLHQRGVKQGDRQLTAVSLAVAVLFLFVTRGRPLPKLSSQTPPSSVLCKGTLVSMAVQFGIHFMAIMAVTLMSDVYVDPYDPSIVPDGPFHPNTLNTATFLVTVLSSINAFLVNYRGRPYMEDLRENKLLFRTIQGCYLVLFICAVEIFPPLNQLMQLSPLPSSGPPLFNIQSGVDDSTAHNLLLGAVASLGFRTMLCIIMCLDTAFVTMAERAIRSIFES